MQEQESRQIYIIERIWSYNNKTSNEKILDTASALRAISYLMDCQNDPFVMLRTSRIVSFKSIQTGTEPGRQKQIEQVVSSIKPRWRSMTSDAI